MKQSDLYRQNAENCMQMAEAAQGEPAYNRYKRMEAALLAFAEEQDWLDGERSPIDPLKKVRGYQMSSKKWNDPQLDAAQFAIDRFLIAQQTVSEQMAEIFQSTRDGCATDEDVKRLKILREQYIALSKEVEDVMGRRLARKQSNDT